MRKRKVTSKTANLRGKFSEPDLRSIFDQESRARASGRRHKATARVAELRNQGIARGNRRIRNAG